jgi:nitrite reductase/ring-hydroxylating ferredoxin subunit
VQRRSFLKWVVGGVSSVLALLGLGSLGLWLNGRRLRAAAAPFRRVVALAELEVGEPRKVPVPDIPAGSWALPPSRPLGEVWLIRRGPDAVDACSARCPHRRGAIEFDGKQFVCPVHGATFDRTGRRVSVRANPAPRDMDPLEVRHVADPATNQVAIEVRYQEFAPGVKERKVVELPR